MTTDLTVQVPPGQKLRPYQYFGAQYMLMRERLLLADAPGVGKTPQAMCVLYTLGVPDTLIVCPKNAIGVWETHCEEWLGIKPHTYVVNKAKYGDITERGHNVLITNYEQLPDVVARRDFWPVVILDESHKIRNRNTKVFTNVKRLGAHYLFLLTGTPVFKGAHDLWTSMAMIAPMKFPAYWPFAKKYAFVDHNGWGQSVYGIQNPKQLAQDIAPYFLRRKKEEVLEDLPEKGRYKIPIHMTPVQKKHYIELWKKMMTEAGDVLILAQSAAVRTTKLRELLVSPRLLGIDDDGAAIPALMERLEERGTPSLIFTPFREGVTHIAAAVRRMGWQAFELRGGMKDKDITEIVRQFQQGDKPRVLISTVQMGTSWTGTAAEQTYFVGYDWAPQVNIQAEDRMHRYGGKGFECYYFCHLGTVDEHVLDINTGKQTIEQLIIDHKILLDIGRM